METDSAIFRGVECLLIKLGDNAELTRSTLDRPEEVEEAVGLCRIQELSRGKYDFQRYEPIDCIAVSVGHKADATSGRESAHASGTRSAERAVQPVPLVAICSPRDATPPSYMTTAVPNPVTGFVKL